MVESLKLEGFRQFSSFEITLASHTVIQGKNGAGKTTLLEALRIISLGKSFKTSRFDELITFEKNILRINAKTSRGELEYFYGQQFPNEPKERQLRVNQQVTDLSGWIGRLPSVVFLPSDTDIISGAPQLRRRYLDSILYQTNVSFRYDYSELQRVLKERSVVLLLVKLNRAGRDELQPWNDLLRGLTERVRSKRQVVTMYLADQISRLSQERRATFDYELSYEYRPESLENLVEEEIKSATNLFGPHRDEIEILVNNRSARIYSSRGQIRTLMVLLKIAEALYLTEKLSASPLILLDDVFSELDQENISFLFNFLPPESQVIATALLDNSSTKEWEKIRL